MSKTAICDRCDKPEPRNYCWDSDENCPCDKPPRYGALPAVSRSAVARLVDTWQLEADANDYDGSGDVSRVYRTCAEQLCRLIKAT